MPRKHSNPKAKKERAKRRRKLSQTVDDWRKDRAPMDQSTAQRACTSPTWLVFEIIKYNMERTHT